jgi:hypothetical protein
LKKLAKVKLPNTIYGLCTTMKVKEFLLEVDNYYDVQKLDKEDKISIDLTFLKDHALQWLTSKKKQESEVVISLTWTSFKDSIFKIGSR